MASLEAKEVKENVEIEVTGEFRRVAIAVEATGISLKPKDGSWKNKNDGDEIPIAFPINVKLTFKGSEKAKFSLTMTIDKKAVKYEDELYQDGINFFNKNFKEEDFK